MQNQQLMGVLKWEGNAKFSICFHLFINFSGQPWLGDIFIVSADSGSLLGILRNQTRKQETGHRILATSLPSQAPGKFTLQRKGKTVSHQTKEGEEKAPCVADLAYSYCG